MSRIGATALKTGIIGGALLALHAYLPNSRGYPMIWPALVGVTAFWIASREPSPHRLRDGLLAALCAGLVAGAVSFVVTSVMVITVMHTVAHSLISSADISKGAITAAVELGLATVAVVAVGVAVLAGLVALPFRYVQSRHAHT
ncbi:MAG TPA: hypothetical protein VGM50_21805 [Gemmatimonadaceae bacterium]